MVLNQGVLEFDYVSTKRPPGSATHMEEAPFNKLLKSLSLIARADPPEALNWLRFASTAAGSYLSGKQIAALLWLFPGHKQPLWDAEGNLTHQEKAQRKEEYLGG